MNLNDCIVVSLDIIDFFSQHIPVRTNFICIELFILLLLIYINWIVELSF
jgi:hypothetical protein